MNIFSLSLGGAICILIWSFISFEFGFDQSFSAPATYRLEMYRESEEGTITKDAMVSSLHVSSWVNNIEELQKLTRLIPYSEEGNAFFSTPKSDGSNGRVHLKDVYFSDSAIFNIFPIQILQHRANEDDKVGIWLSKSVMIKYFGEDYFENPDLWNWTFEAIRNNGLPSPKYRIAGVFEDLKLNTHIHFDAFILPTANYNPLSKNAACYAYITTNKALESSQRKISLPNLPEGQNLYARPVIDIHFTKDISNNQKPAANEVLLIFLGVVGLIILLLSITNYTIGAIFNTIERMREIGVRKLIGMKPAHLVANFFLESLLIHILAGFLAVVIFEYLINNSLPFLPDQKEIGMNNPLDLKAIGSVGLGRTIGFAVILFLSSTILSCLYPTIYFNKIRPVYLLKGKLQLLNSSLLTGATRVTEFLLLFQLIASSIFLSGLFMVNSQLEYLTEQQIAPFDVQVRAIFPGVTGVNTKFNEMAEIPLNQARESGGLRQISYSNLYQNELTTIGTISVGLSELDTLNTLNLHIVDHAYWRDDTTAFLAGQNFSPVFGTEPNHVILNESAVHQLKLGSSEEVVGDTIFSNMGPFVILGVTRQSEEEAIVYASGFRYRTFIDLTLHYNGGQSNQESVYDFLRKTEVQLSTAFPYITILKRDFQKERFLEQGMSGLFFLFSILALLIASFGLFSLSSFLTEKRAKEMDIRKLLGASPLQLILLVSANLFRILGLAIVLATPVVFFAGNYWLDQYSGRIPFDMLWVLKPAFLILMVSLLVAVPKSWQKARSNLANSLRG